MAFSFCRTRFLQQRIFCARYYSGDRSKHGQFIETKHDPSTHTHFGFETIRKLDKVKKVQKVFDDVASKYDVMNDLMSVGIHRLWKDEFVNRLSPTKNTNLLDVAGGTGDIAFRFLNYIKTMQCEKDCHVTVCDINNAMLEIGRKRCNSLNHNLQMISWIEGNAENLPFKEESFNAYTIAFGIRNCTNVDKVLKEAYRVLQPGGRFLCMEFSQLESSIVQWFYDQYSYQVIPVMGQLVTGKWQPYQYLVESIRKFPDQETFKSMVEQAGFRQTTYENLNMGIVAIHSAFKI